jgi:hypothetical protein
MNIVEDVTFMRDILFAIAFAIVVDNFDFLSHCWKITEQYFYYQTLLTH